MKLAVCGSLKFFKEMQEVQHELELSGHSVLLPQRFADTNYDNKDILEGVRNIVSRNAIKEHYEKIIGSDAVFVLNYSHHGIDNYIGGNTFLEMGFAYVNDKRIFVMNPLPTQVNYLEEMLGMQPVILNGDLNKIGESD